MTFGILPDGVVSGAAGVVSGADGVVSGAAGVVSGAQIITLSN